MAITRKTFDTGSGAASSLDHQPGRTAMPKTQGTPAPWFKAGRQTKSFAYKSEASGTPTSILNGGKQSFGPLKGGYGEISDGDGDVGATYKRGGLSGSAGKYDKGIP